MGWHVGGQPKIGREGGGTHIIILINGSEAKKNLKSLYGQKKKTFFPNGVATGVASPPFGGGGMATPGPPGFGPAKESHQIYGICGKVF